MRNLEVLTRTLASVILAVSNAAADLDDGAGVECRLQPQMGLDEFSEVREEMCPGLDFRKESMKMRPEKMERGFRLGASVLVLTVLSACGHEGTQAPAAPKTSVWTDAAYRAVLTPSNPLTAGAAGSKATMTVDVKNVSETTWLEHREDFPLNFSYHWRDSAGNVVIRDGERTPVPVSLAPDKSVTIQAAILLPPKPGEYVLEIDLVLETVAWFGDKGSQTSKLSVRVE